MIIYVYENQYGCRRHLVPVSFFFFFLNYWYITFNFPVSGFEFVQIESAGIRLRKISLFASKKITTAWNHERSKKWQTDIHSLIDEGLTSGGPGGKWVSKSLSVFVFTLLINIVHICAYIYCITGLKAMYASFFLIHRT